MAVPCSYIRECRDGSDEFRLIYRLQLALDVRPVKVIRTPLNPGVGGLLLGRGLLQCSLELRTMPVHSSRRTSALLLGKPCL